MSQFPRNIGSEVLFKPSIRPLESAAAGSFAITGIGIDRQSFLSALLCVSVGASSGSPSALAVDVKVQDSDDNSSFADVSGAAISQITAVNTHTTLALDLSGRKRYVRVLGQVAFTGGSSPKVGLSASLMLGGATIEPVTQG